ncbi:MAG: hypothetical protein V4609_19520 [Pseudomonadota bacterium]
MSLDGPVSSVLSMDPAGDIYLAQHLPSQALGATVGNCLDGDD